MSERFPDVDWFCDRCGDYLNVQSGLDDHRYLWRCAACGFKSSISSANIVEAHEDFQAGSADEPFVVAYVVPRRLTTCGRYVLEENLGIVIVAAFPPF